MLNVIISTTQATKYDENIRKLSLYRELFHISLKGMYKIGEITKKQITVKQQLNLTDSLEN